MPSPRRMLGLAAVAMLGCGEDCPPPEGEWRPMSLVGGPGARELPAVVWTGAEMIVWGGMRGGERRADGARYRPSMDEWSAMADAPAALTGTAAVWTGAEMIVWDPTAAGAAYDPVADAWRSIASEGQPRDLALPLAVWTGAEMIVLDQFGGRGGRYAPAGDRWTPVAGEGLPAEIIFFGAAWTAAEVIAWGAVEDFAPAAYRYDPADDRWSPMEANRAMAGAGVWTGRELFFAGGGGLGSLIAAGFDPTTDIWREAATSCGPPGVLGQSVAWTGERVIVWGGTDIVGRELEATAGGALYDPAADAWTPMAADSAPSPRERAAAVWTGSELIVWGGFDGGADPRGDGARFTPAST
jgi:hypothetical protein